MYHSKQKRVVFLGVSCMAFLLNADISVINLAIAAIARDFNSTLNQMQWVINIYLLVAVIFLIVSGNLADIFGKKKIYLAGILFFILGSLISGLSFCIETLVVGRLVQGLGLAFSLSLGIVIATTIFPSEKRGFVIGIYMAVAGLSQALGPLVGGCLLQLLNWRWIFFINIPIGILAWVLIVRYYREERVFVPLPCVKKIDVPGFVLLAMALALLLAAANNLGTWGLDSLTFYIVLGSALVMFTALYRQEIKTPAPLVDFSLYHHRTYRYVSSVRLLFTYNWLAILFCVPLYLQNVVLFSPIKTSLVILGVSLSFALFSPVSGKIMDRVGFVIPTIVAACCGTVSPFLLTFLSVEPHWELFMASLLLLGVGSALMGTGSGGIAMSSIAKEKMGVGMGTFFTKMFLGGSLGVAISGSIIKLVSSLYLDAHHLIPVSKTVFITLQQVASGAQSINLLSGLFQATQEKIMITLVKESFIHGFSVAMWFCVIMGVISVILCFQLFDAKSDVSATEIAQR